MASYIKQLKDADGNNIYPIAYVNGGMKMDLLWTNPNPTVNFSTQTISLNLSSYDFVGIVFLNNKSLYGVEEEFSEIKIFKKGTGTFSVGVAYSTGRNQTGREVDGINNTGITFGSGFYGSTVSDEIGIPYQIYGIKMTYVVPTAVQGLEYEEI